jgi:hypothetical protein
MAMWSEVKVRAGPDWSDRESEAAFGSAPSDHSSAPTLRCQRSSSEDRERSKRAIGSAARSPLQQSVGTTTAAGQLKLNRARFAMNQQCVAHSEPVQCRGALHTEIASDGQR